MAITITPNLTDISLCEATTGWAGGTYLATDGALKLQGTYSLSDWIDATTSAVEKFTFATAKNLSNGEHLYIWVMCTGLVDTKANGGYRLYAETDASNYSTWYVAGSDTLGGGWQLLTVDLAATRTSGLGTLNLSSITKVGVQFKVLTAGPIKGQTRFNNVFWDAFRYGTGLTITSGSTDQISFEDIFAVDDLVTNKYGVVQKVYGSYIIQGKLIFGNTSGSHIDFYDTNQMIIFPDNPLVADNFYGFSVLSSSTGTTNFVLGDKSGSVGINGCIFKSVGTKTFDLNLGDNNNNKAQLYGSSFTNAGLVTLPLSGSNREVLNCSFTTSDGVIVSTCTMTNCNIISADDEGVLLSSESHAMTFTNFIGNPNALRIDTAGTYDLERIIFSNNTVDIDNTSGGAVIINCLDGSNPTTYTGNTTIINAVSLKVIVVDKNNKPLEDVQTAIYKASDDTELMNEDTQTLTAGNFVIGDTYKIISVGTTDFTTIGATSNTVGVVFIATGVGAGTGTATDGAASQTYNYPGSPVNIYVRVRKSSTGATKYIPSGTTGTILGTGFSAKITLLVDSTAT